MSIWNRLKSMAGGHKPLVTVASATSLTLPDDDNAFYLSGSATITSLLVPQHVRNREVTFIGATGAAVTFTHTVGSTTNGQMDLGSENIVLSAKDVLRLYCNENGVWQLVSYQQNNAVSVSLASATTVTLPSTADTFILTGTATVTTINAAASSKYRTVKFLGGSLISGPTMANNNSPTAGQMYLSGSDRSLTLDKVLVLVLMPDGTWNMQSFSV